MERPLCGSGSRRRAGTVSALLVPAVALAAFALIGAPPGRTPGEVKLVRVGADRGIRGYREREPRAKEAVLRRINHERSAYGLPALAYDLLGARVGDDFCFDSASTGSVGHWDVAGRAPYLRWSLAGGVDFHGENFASQSRMGYDYRERAEDLLLEAHARFMAEKPPNDGHRRAVLDPGWTHVGIGMAIVGGEFRMTEEFSRRVLDWVEIPAGPVPAGSVVPFAAQLPPGWNVASIELVHEAVPRPLSLAELARRGAYAYPKAVLTLRPFPPAGSVWRDGAKGTFPSQGTFSMKLPLDAGPGDYYVVVFAGEGNVAGRPTTPVAAPLIRAE